MQDNRRRDWLAILDEFGPQLDESAASERLDVFLRFLGDEVGWPASEYWLRQGDSLTQVAESHVESVVLDTFERHQSTFVVNIDWTTVREIWPESDPDPRNVAWIKSPADSRLCPRPEAIREAGLNTLIVVPVPNGTYLQRNVLLWDFEARDEQPDEIHALKIAAWMFGRFLERDETPMPAVAQPSSAATLQLDPHTRSLVGPGGGQKLTVYEWDFLSILFQHAGEAVSFADLSQGVWRAPENYVGRAVIYELVARLRPALSRIGSGNWRIASVPRYGYVLEHAS